MLPFLNILGVKIPTYGICLIIGIFLSSLMAYHSIKKDKTITKEKVPPEYLLIILVICIFAFIVGARLLFILVTYDISYIVEQISKPNLSFITQNSGMVFYGGLIFGIIGALIAAHFTKIDLLEIERHIVPYIPLGHAIGRIGCLLGGCCYGMRYSGFGAVYYKHSVIGLPPDVGFFPVQPLEALLDIFIMFIMLTYTKKTRPKGNVLSFYLLLYAIMRFITELFRGDSFRGIFSGFSTSQWISIGLIVFFFTRLTILRICKKGQIKHTDFS
ncbi:MAG: prolipoprotein diacylglyceryl transferase [Clostridia bacterium]|nr:prolipoprotein diacylglyceryl transferase [Clostridia bacterium]